MQKFYIVKVTLPTSTDEEETEDCWKYVARSIELALIILIDDLREGSLIRKFETRNDLLNGDISPPSRTHYESGDGN